MRTPVLLAFSFCCVFAAVAQADPVVSLGTYTFDRRFLSRPIPIQIFAWNDTTTGNFTGVPSNSPNQQGVQGLDLNIKIANLDGSDIVGAGPTFVMGTGGQPYVGPASGPSTGGDVLTGTIFATTAEGGTHLSPATATHTPPSDGGGSSSRNLQTALNVSGGRATMASGAGVAPANRSLIATIYIDITSVIRGDWALEIGGNPDHGPDNGPLDFSDGGTLNTVLVDGVIHVIFPTPQPSMLVLACLGAAGLAVTALRKRNRRAA